MLAPSIDESGGEWEEHLPKVCFAYNTSKQSSTWLTLFQLMYGQQAQIPLDAIFKIPGPEPTMTFTVCHQLVSISGQGIPIRIDKI